MPRVLFAALTSAVLLCVETAPAHAAPDPTPARVVVVGSQLAALPNDDTLQVTAEFRNDNPTTVNYATVRLQVFDAAGALVGEQDTGLVAVNLAPGATSPTKFVLSPIPKGYDHYTVSASDTPLAYQLANTNFTTEVTSVVDNSVYGYDTTTVSGYVTNHNTGPSAIPTVYGVYRDAGGAIADLQAAMVDDPSGSLEIGAGVKVRWTYELAGDAKSRDAGLSLGMFASAESDPLPMTNDVGTRPGAVLPYGGTIAPTVSVVKSTTNGAPTNNGTITTLQRQSGASWVNVSSVRTYDGSVRFAAQRPTVRTVYRAVTPANNATVLRAGAAFVVQARMQITGTLSASTVRHGSAATLTGRTSVAHPGQRVYLQRLTSGVWRSISAIALSSSSTYRFALPTGGAGTSYYRVLKPTDSVNYESVSGKLTLKVT